MPTYANTSYADIDGMVQTILEGSVETLVQQNLLAATVTVFRDTNGMNPRKVYRWGTATMRSLSEGEDMVPEKISKTSLNTLTPARYGDQVLLTDERLSSDWDNVRDETVMLLGGAAARYIDQSIGTCVAGLTGGTVTVNSGLGTLNWSHIMAARAIAQQSNIPGPYFCTLGAGQWYHLINNGGTAVSSTFMRSDAFQDRIVTNYFVTAMFGDITFVISNGLKNAAAGTCYGALYNRAAMAYDERTPFTLEPQRDASKSAWELNVNFRYAVGTWDPLKGIQIISTDVIPTT